MKLPVLCMLTLAAVLASGATRAADLEEDAFDTNDSAGVDTDTKARCWMMGQAFYKLAYLRDGGSDKKTAAYNVSRWLAQKGNTGSHVVGFDYSKAATAAADPVYARKDLYPATLSGYGGRSCKIQKIFEGAPEKQQAGTMLMLQAAESCQAKNPGQHHNGALRQCLREAESSIVERVRKATIKVE